ncbi:MAG: hypothetical protein V3V62_09985 [bacterium]
MDRARAAAAAGKGGEFEIEGALGAGTRVTVRLPAGGAAEAE